VSSAHSSLEKVLESRYRSCLKIGLVSVVTTIGLIHQFMHQNNNLSSSLLRFPETTALDPLKLRGLVQMMASSKERLVGTVEHKFKKDTPTSVQQSIIAYANPIHEDKCVLIQTLLEETTHMYQELLNTAPKELDTMEIVTDACKQLSWYFQQSYSYMINSYLPKSPSFYSEFDQFDSVAFRLYRNLNLYVVDAKNTNSLPIIIDIVAQESIETVLHSLSDGLSQGSSSIDTIVSTFEPNSRKHIGDLESMASIAISIFMRNVLSDKKKSYYIVEAGLMNVVSFIVTACSLLNTDLVLGDKRACLTMIDSIFYLSYLLIYCSTYVDPKTRKIRTVTTGKYPSHVVLPEIFTVRITAVSKFVKEHNGEFDFSSFAMRNTTLRRTVNSNISGIVEKLSDKQVGEIIKRVVTETERLIPRLFEMKTMTTYKGHSEEVYSEAMKSTIFVLNRFGFFGKITAESFNIPQLRTIISLFSSMQLVDDGGKQKLLKKVLGEVFTKSLGDEFDEDYWEPLIKQAVSS
jgi:hypothetical protein